MTQPLIVADAGPLIALAVADLLPAALALFGKVLVPQAVLRECTADRYAPGAQAIAALLTQPASEGGALVVVTDAEIVPLDAAYTAGLGSGEAAVLGYALQYRYTALVDDRRARRVAQRLDVATVGSGTVLLALKSAGRIASIRPALEAWAAHGYYVAPKVVAALLERAGEVK